MIFVFRYQEQKSGIYRIWPEANQAGHLLQTAGSDYLPVSQIAVEYGPVTVCNFEVAEAHDYFVSDENVLVHNAPCPANMSPAGAGRRGAFRQAKRDLGVPNSAQPKVNMVRDRHRPGVMQREYDFGNGRVIKDHNLGHPGNGSNGPNQRHFNSGNNHYFY